MSRPRKELFRKANGAGSASPKRARKQPSEGLTDLRITYHDTEALVELAKRELRHVSPGPMPKGLKPMLARSADTPFSSQDWQFEIKLDGYRALAFLQQGKADLRSRNQQSLNTRFAPIQTALDQWKINAVIDGEIVVLDQEGRSTFSGIQQWSNKGGYLVYFIFDLLWLDGLDLTAEPLTRRQELLRRLMPEHPQIRFCDHIDAEGIAFFELARENRLEGIIAKRKDAPYLPGTRSADWLKIKCMQEEEVVIGGFACSGNGNRPFSSLLLGRYENGKLVYIGQAGTGFSDQQQRELLRRMRPLVTRQSPFHPPPSTRQEVFWLKPALVATVRFTELTEGQRLRHASFLGLRNDKTVRELNKEI
jgi:bifunctional non-homologous end joining protein LigD